jgi:hypothetical protein
LIDYIYKDNGGVSPLYDDFETLYDDFEIFVKSEN